MKTKKIGLMSTFEENERGYIFYKDLGPLKAFEVDSLKERAAMSKEERLNQDVSNGIVDFIPTKSELISKTLVAHAQAISRYLDDNTEYTLESLNTTIDEQGIKTKGIVILPN